MPPDCLSLEEIAQFKRRKELESKREYRRTHPLTEKQKESRRLRNRKYKKRNRSKVLESKRRYREAHPLTEARRQKIREYKRLHKSLVLAQKRRHYRRHRSRILARSAEYRKENAGKIQERRKRLRDRLSRGYVVCKLVNGTCLRAADVPEVLVELKRAELALKRRLRDGNKNHNCSTAAR